MKYFLIPLEWLLLTIQFRHYKAYEIVKKEQERRAKENEAPWDRPWTYKLKKCFWILYHKYVTDYWPKELVDSYYKLIHILACKSEDLDADHFKFNHHTIRLSGATIVIDEKWAINGGGKGIYVHKRVSKEADWDLVYRTDSVMKDTGFLKLLDTASRAECFLLPLVEEDSLDPAIPTTVN